MLNAAGQVAFVADLTGSCRCSDTGVWSEGSGNLELLARTGIHAPGTPSGINFGSFDTPTLALNGAGQTVFLAYLTGSSVNITNNTGIWATDKNGTLQLIARSGDLFEVALGDFRTIRGLGIVGGTGNGDGRPSGFNDQGQLAFLAYFTDGSRSELFPIWSPSPNQIRCCYSPRPRRDLHSFNPGSEHNPPAALFPTQRRGMSEASGKKEQRSRSRAIVLVGTRLRV